MAKNWQEKIISIIAGELENFSKDAIEYYQKTGMAYPPELSLTAKRIFALTEVDEAEQRGIRKVKEWVKQNNIIPPHKSGCYGVIQPDPSCPNCKWQAFLKGVEK